MNLLVEVHCKQSPSPVRITCSGRRCRSRCFSTASSWQLRGSSFSHWVCGVRLICRVPHGVCPTLPKVHTAHRRTACLKRSPSSMLYFQDDTALSAPLNFYVPSIHADWNSMCLLVLTLCAFSVRTFIAMRFLWLEIFTVSFVRVVLGGAHLGGVGGPRLLLCIFSCWRRTLCLGFLFLRVLCMLSAKAIVHMVYGWGISLSVYFGNVVPQCAVCTFITCHGPRMLSVQLLLSALVLVDLAQIQPHMSKGRFHLIK